MGGDPAVCYCGIESIEGPDTMAQLVPVLPVLGGIML